MKQLSQVHCKIEPLQVSINFNHQLLAEAAKYVLRGSVVMTTKKNCGPIFKLLKKMFYHTVMSKEGKQSEPTPQGGVL